MSDFTFLLKEVERLRSAGQTFAVGTVVNIAGSTYRQAGGRMLVREDLSTWGLISGGCLEEEIAREAEAVLQTGRPVVQSYDMTGPDDRLGFNTGCNGRVDVLITRDSPALTHLEAAVRQRTGGVLVQMVSGEIAPGSADWITVDDLASLRTDQALQREVRKVLRQQRTTLFRQPHRSLLLEYVRPPIHLLIFGTGADVDPLVKIAALLGWTVTLVGHRPKPWLQEHFPSAHHHVFLMHPEAVGEHISTDGRTVAVIMNHNLDRDRTLTRELLNSAIPYVGLLGPRARFREIAQTALEASIETAALDRLYGPAGLDTGAESPEEIALSMAAEILSVTNRRPATHLREGSGPIHTLCTTGSQ